MMLQAKDELTTRATLELLYHISRELSAALDLRTVLERVLFLSMQNVGAISGSIIVLDENEKPIESAIIFGEQVRDHTTQQLRATLDYGLAGWVMRNRQAVLVQDTSQDDRWLSRQYEIDEKTQPKSAVSAPLLTRDMLVGVMTLVHPQVHFFRDEHLALVQAIADQAGIAVVNARLYAESQRQARVSTALATSASGITASLNLEDVLAGIMEQTSQALSAKAVSLALIDPHDGMLVFQAATGWAKHQVIDTRLSIGQGIAGWVAEHGEGVIVQDTSVDTRFDSETDRRTGFKTSAIACAPIRYRGEVIGVLEALNPDEVYFDPDSLFVLTGIGSLAGTAIRHAQLFEQLQAAHQSYRDLFEDSIDPILITNWEGEILEVNRKATLATDFSADDLHRMRIGQLHAIDLEQTGENFEELRSGQTYHYESRLRTRSGHEVPIEVYIRQVKVEDPPRVQWIFRDITERKNLDTLRDDLISMIYHDLRSPLANVVSSLDVLDTMLPPGEEENLKPLLDIALRSTERIQRLTDSLLDMSRLEAGQPIGNRQAISIETIIRDAVDTVTVIVQNKNQRIEVEPLAGTIEVWVDPDMIRRVITNLLENATKYTPSGGLIRMGVYRKDEMVYTWVLDNGPGIPASEHERIFDKFSRLYAREGPKGLGLGLAYCRMAVQGHGGRIWVESEPGSGSRFTFTLPTLGR
ncbi:MAG: GAF domain-containing protein [Anaerolineales bacterium]|nr:GAF domain-containing protein [Anaerolineales bacterium]